MPRKAKVKIEFNINITPCFFKDDDFMCLNIASEMCNNYPSNNYCEKCIYKEAIQND